jgi:hypothetical protein
VSENVFIEDAEEFMQKSKAYRHVLAHRRKCKKWGKLYCRECFGGGLTKFSRALAEERFTALQKKWEEDVKHGFV